MRVLWNAWFPVLVGWLALGGAGTAHAGKPSDTIVKGDLGKRIDEAVAKATEGGFWGTVLVARGGEVVFAKGYGSSDYAKRPNAPDTLFEIASTSKQVAAAAILKLEQQKRLKVTDTLDTFWKDLPADKHEVTLHHLLTHTSGLADDLGVPYASPISRPEYVRTMLARPLAREPGTKFSYSNVGYALLAAVVETVADVSFEDYVRKELFTPAGLKDTGFVGDSRLAKSDRITKRKGDPSPDATAAKWHWGWGYRGMGGVVTTALDLNAWDRALRGDKVLGAAAKKTLYEPALEGYACGWKVETTERGTRRVHHSGGVKGFACQVSRWLEEDALVVVLSNGDSDLFAVERAVVRLLFAPAKVEADLDLGPFTANEYGALPHAEGATWKARVEGGAVRLDLVAKKHTLASIRLPKAYAKKVAQDLHSVLAAKASDASAASDARGMEAGIYLGMYGRGVRKQHLEEGLEIEVQPQYRGRDTDGKPVVDERALLILVDTQKRGWPLMAKMDVKSAEALVAVLREAAG